MTLKAAVAEQAPRYAEIKAPVTIIAGDADKTVSTNIHSRPFAATAPNAKLIVLPGVGHMIQYAAPDLVIAEIEAMIGAIAPARQRRLIEACGSRVYPTAFCAIKDDGDAARGLTAPDGIRSLRAGFRCSSRSG